MTLTLPKCDLVWCDLELLSSLDPGLLLGSPGDPVLSVSVTARRHIGVVDLHVVRGYTVTPPQLPGYAPVPVKF